MITFRLMTLALAPAVLITSIVTPGLAQNLPYGAPIGIELAKQAAQSAAAEMHKRDLQMTIAVVNSGSNLVYLNAPIRPASAPSTRRSARPRPRTGSSLRRRPSRI